MHTARPPGPRTPTALTVPASLATIGEPYGAAMSMPVWPGERLPGTRLGRIGESVGVRERLRGDAVVRRDGEERFAGRDHMRSERRRFPTDLRDERAARAHDRPWDGHIIRRVERRRMPRGNGERADALEVWSRRHGRDGHHDGEDAAPGDHGGPRPPARRSQ